MIDIKGTNATVTKSDGMLPDSLLAPAWNDLRTPIVTTLLPNDHTKAVNSQHAHTSMATTGSGTY
jgi:hypothetical protein